MTWFLCLLVGLTFFNCTPNIPEIPENLKKTPTTKKEPASLGTIDPVPSESIVSMSSQIHLPRDLEALYVFGKMSFACTREGSLYNAPKTDQPTYLLTAINLVNGKVQWRRPNTQCNFRIHNNSLYLVNALEKKQPTLRIHVLDLQTGKQQRTFNVAHRGCRVSHLTGTGERMFAKQPTSKLPCFRLEFQKGQLVFTNDQSVQIIDPTTGKVTWKREAQKGIGRIPAATLHEGIIYMMLASKQLPPTTTSTGDTFSSLHAKTWKYQLRAIDVKTGKQLWNVGPFPPPVLQATIHVAQRAVYVQTLSPYLSTPSDIKETITYYEKIGWEGRISTYSFAKENGKPMWQKPLTVTKGIKKYAMAVPPRLSPMLIEKQQATFLLGKAVIRVTEQGKQLWSVNVIKESFDPEKSQPKRKVLRKTQTIQIFSLANKTLHIRGDMGELTLIGYGETAGRSYYKGSLLHGASPEIAKLVTGSQPPQKPGQFIQTEGFCEKVDGTDVPMSEVQSETRFFLPIGRSYYGPNQFFTAFCTNYRVSLEAKSFDWTQKNPSQLWNLEVNVPEAPIFSFMRGERLYIVSDNGDFYGYTIK